MYMKAKEFKALIDSTPGLSDVLSIGNFKVGFLSDVLGISIESARKLISKLVLLNALKNAEKGYKLEGEAAMYFKNMKQKAAIDSQKDFWINMFNEMISSEIPNVSKQIKCLCDNYGMDKLIKFLVENPTFKAYKLKTYLGIGTASNPNYGLFNFDVLLPLLDACILMKLSMDVEPPKDGILKVSDINELMNMEYCIHPDLFDQDNSQFGPLENIF